MAGGGENGRTAEQVLLCPDGSAKQKLLGAASGEGLSPSIRAACAVLRREGAVSPPDPSDPEQRSAHARVGTVLGAKWTLERLVGVGGMACVYAARHRNGKRGAVKVLHAECARDADARARFLREGYVANRVDHPGAVSVLDDDVAEDGSAYLVMELLEGEPVDAIAERRPARRLDVGEVLRIAHDVLDVLAAAHEKGIVHRDIKPENLFLTHRCELRVLDFGIARLRELTTTARATTTGAAMGTPAFMAPEQALGNWDAVDGRTDLWAVGATMFTLLTGRYVHDAPTVQKLMLAAMTAPAPPLASVLPEAPARLCRLVDRALAFAPQDRWRDARAMQHAVREVLDGGVAATLVSMAGELPQLPRPSAVTGGERAERASAPGSASIDSSARVSRTAMPIARDPTWPAPPARVRLVVGAALVAAATGVVATVLLFGWSASAPRAPASAASERTLVEPSPPPASSVPQPEPSGSAHEVAASPSATASSVAPRPAAAAPAKAKAGPPKAAGAASAVTASPSVAPAKTTDKPPRPSADPFERRN